MALVPAGLELEPLRYPAGESTARIVNRCCLVDELPISYAGRGYDEGKIACTAGVALRVLVNYRFSE